VIDKVRAKIKWVRSSGFLAGLTFFFASSLFFYDLLTGRYLFTERDLGPYFIPPRFFWVESIKHSDFPLWNPYQFSGHPFLANPQNAILYPLNSLFFLLPFDVAFNAIIILHFFLGGFFTYLFLKDLKVNSSGALISGLIFMLSGYLLSVHSLLTFILSVIWTPLILMFFRRAIISPGFKNEIFTAIFMTISFLGGAIEIVYGNFFILLFTAIFSIPSDSSTGKQEGRGEGQRRNLWLKGRGLILVSIIFLLLSAIQLIPFLELYKDSIRGGGITYQEATIWSFAPKDILLFFLPDAYGYFLDMKKYWVTQCWYKTLYTGGLPFILGSFFFLFGKGRKVYLALMLFSLFLSLGQYNPFYPLVFKYVPFFNGIRYPAKFLYILILAFSIIAGLGFQRLTDFAKERENKRFNNILLIFSFVSGLLLLILVLSHKEIAHHLTLRGFDFPDFNHLSVNLYHGKRFLFYLAIFFLLLRIGQEVKWKGWVRVLLIFFLAADLFGNMGFYGMEKTSDYFRQTRILQMISSDRGPFRIFSTGKTISRDTPILIGGPSHLNILKEKHIPSMNLLYQFHDIWGIDVIRLKRVDDLYRAFTAAPSITATNLVDLYGVKYIISVTPIEDGNHFELIYSRIEGLQGRKEDLLKENTIKLYKNHHVLPRAWLVKDFRILDAHKILFTMIRKDFYPDKEVLLEEVPPSLTLPHKGGGGGGGVVQLILEKNNELHLRVRTTGDTLLVLSDTYFPGWKAFVNGKETKIYRANYAFRAIALGAGINHVEFVYDPVSFKLGAIITFLTIMVCLVIGLVTRRCRFQPHPKNTQKRTT
jgi:hypothetical protein